MIFSLAAAVLRMFVFLTNLFDVFVIYCGMVFCILLNELIWRCNCALATSLICLILLGGYQHATPLTTFNFISPIRDHGIITVRHKLTHLLFNLHPLHFVRRAVPNYTAADDLPIIYFRLVASNQGKVFRWRCSTIYKLSCNVDVRSHLLLIRKCDAIFVAWLSVCDQVRDLHVLDWANDLIGAEECFV